MLYYVSGGFNTVKLYYSLLTAIAISIGISIPVSYGDPDIPSPQATKPLQKLPDFTAISVRGPIKLIIEEPAEGRGTPFKLMVNNTALSV